MNDDFRYVPLNEEQYSNICNKHYSVIEKFLMNNRYSLDKVDINEKILLSIIAKVDQRQKYFQYFHGLKMSEFKEVSLICFWYIKLKPIRISCENCKDGKLDAINEKLALYYLLSLYRKMLKDHGLPTDVLDRLPEEYIKEVLYSFKYCDISKEAFTLLAESIAVFLGLNPYTINTKM